MYGFTEEKQITHLIETYLYANLSLLKYFHFKK